MITVTEDVTAQKTQKTLETKPFIRKDAFKSNRLSTIPVIDPGRCLVMDVNDLRFRTISEPVA